MDPVPIEKRRRLDLHAIEHIRTPFLESAGTPIQAVYARGAEGQVVVDEAFASALDVDMLDDTPLLGNRDLAGRAKVA